MPPLSFTRAARALVLATMGVAPPAALAAQDAPARAGRADTLTLVAARAAARETSPDLRALREGVAAAAARERQAGALPNPTLAYGHEQTSRDGRSNAQHIAQLEQPLELGGQRGARRGAARLRRLGAEARLAAAEAQLDFDVTRAYATAVAAERRATLAAQAAATFTEARRVSQARLAAGDISGYADRRLRLEAARYAAQRAEAAVAREAARVALATLVGEGDAPARLVLADTLPSDAPAVTLPAADSLARIAVAQRAELRAATFEAEAAVAEARLAARERVPVPVLSAGLKTEQVADTTGAQGGFRGLVAGVSLPLPLFDRRGGAVAAAEAEARRRSAETEALRRRVVREVGEAEAALRALSGEIGALAPQLGREADLALRAARAAYGEGEITLAEFLDAVRAYQEAEASYATLRAEVLVRRAALERAVGAPVTGPPSSED